jgi:hypothetical protein
MLENSALYARTRETPSNKGLVGVLRTYRAESIIH